MTDGCLISTISLKTHFQLPHPVLGEFNQFWGTPLSSARASQWSFLCHKRCVSLMFSWVCWPWLTHQCTVKSHRGRESRVARLKSTFMSAFMYITVEPCLFLPGVLMPSPVRACNIQSLNKCCTKLYWVLFVCCFPRWPLLLFLIFFMTNAGAVRTGTTLSRVVREYHLKSYSVFIPGLFFLSLNYSI